MKIRRLARRDRRIFSMLYFTDQVCNPGFSPAELQFAGVYDISRPL
jgi:hypothetical protein